MQDWVKGARADAIAMAGQLVDHRLAKDGTFGGVVQDVEADQAGIETAVIHRISTSDFDIETRV
jgi:hypothetical protein